jgi:hypothetical protein
MLYKNVFSVLRDKYIVNVDSSSGSLKVVTMTVMQTIQSVISSFYGFRFEAVPGRKRAELMCRVVSSTAASNQLLPYMLAASLSPHRHMFDLKAVYVGFMVDQVAVGQTSLRVFQFYSIRITPLVLYSRFRLHASLIRRTRGHILGNIIAANSQSISL